MIVRKSVTSLQHLPSTHCILDPDQSRIRAQFPASARRTFHQRDDFVPVWSSSSSLQLHLSINRELKQIEILIKANLKANRRRPPDVSLLPVHVPNFCERRPASSARTWHLQNQANKQTKQNYKRKDVACEMRVVCCWHRNTYILNPNESAVFVQRLSTR